MGTKYKENKDKQKETSEKFHENCRIKKDMSGKWKGTRRQKCHTNKENQGHYTRVDDDIERSYKNYSKEKYLFNKRYFLIWIRCLTARIIDTHCLYMIQKPAVDNIPDKKQKSKESTYYETQEKLMESPNDLKDVWEYHVPKFYQDIRKLQPKQEFVR